MKSLLVTLTKPLRLLVGSFLLDSPTWIHIRQNCFNFPGKNFHSEIRKHSIILWVLNKSDYEYFEFKYRKLSQQEWQKVHWEDYGKFYNAAVEAVDRKMHPFMLSQLQKHGGSTFVEIGCGGFALSKTLADHLPDSRIVAYDISSSSQEIYDNFIAHQFLNIEFVRRSFFDDLDAIASSGIFFTSNVMMHLTPEELDVFLNFLSQSDKKIFGVIQEPYTQDNNAINFKDRDWKHNFFLSIERNNLTMLDHHIVHENKSAAGTSSAIFCFSNKAI